MKTLLTYRKAVVALFAILFTLTLHGVRSAPAYTHIYVDAVSGTNAPTGRGAASSPYQSITYALLISARNNLADPWHVHIHPGTYNADPAKGSAREIFPLKLRQEMIFEGTTTAAECIIDGQHTGAATVPILSGEDTEGVTIRNLTIRNSLRTNATGGIVLHDPTGTKETPSTLEGCVVHNNKGGGLWSNMPLILTGNTFSSNNTGAGVWTSKSAAATNNVFSGNNRSGLRIEGSSTGNISENTFRDNWQQGLHVNGTLEGNITDNIFIGNGGRRGGGLYVKSVVGNLTHNTFAGNSADQGSGFFIENFMGDITHNTVDSNTAKYNGGGCQIVTVTGNLTHNKFTGNTEGGFASSIFTGNIIHNIFTRNSKDGGFRISQRFTGNITHNIFDSNSDDFGAGAFYLENGARSPNIVKVFNNIFFNNISNQTGHSTGNSVVTKQATHFMNNLFMISDELSEGVSDAHTIWVSSPECRFHNNIFSGLKIAIYTDGTFDLPITHNLFHNVKVDFVEQAGNNLGNDLLFWELVAVNATNNLEGNPHLVDPVTTRDFHLQATSPAINAGTNAFAPADDLDGVTRPVGRIVDIGPYEYGGTPTVTRPDPTTTTPDPDVTTSDPTVDDEPPSTVAFRVKGGAAQDFTDSKGRVWRGARQSHQTWGGWIEKRPLATTVATLTADAQAQAEEAGYDAELFHGVSWARHPDTVKYQFKTGNGTFDVTYLVGEHWSPNNRGFDIIIEGEVVEPLYVTPGRHEIDIKTYKGIEVSDGALDIQLSGNRNSGVRSVNPMFSALEVVTSVAEPITETDEMVDEYPAWDVNEDGKTDIPDLLLVAEVFGSTNPDNPRIDVNGDGTVDKQDIIIVATHLGESTDAAAPISIALPERLTPETLQQALNLLRAHNDGSLAFQRAIANLEQLLASLIPKETMLLANYPNPFNPETWIPYQLVNPADVTVHIYGINGTLVRTLSIGHQAAGMYHSRSRAAYWDGKNAVGEPVASGIYFYTLTAGDFTATRKMLIRK